MPTLDDKHDARRSRSVISRRSVLRGGLAAGGTGVVGAGLLMRGLPASAAARTRGVTRGDIAILRFLAAAEIIETDLWQQYNELAGIQDSEVPGGSGNTLYTNAILQLDMDMSQYIHDNTEDEHSHFQFINAYLMSVGADPVDLTHFKRLPSSTADGAQNIGRITNLMQLTVDTTWWTRYRSRTGNPDFGDKFPPAVPGLLQGKFPAIPRSNDDLDPPNHIQAIANTAGFHFGFIEQGGSSLYPSLAQRVTNPEVLRILLSIGPTETSHFQTWHDKAGNAPAVTDPTNGLAFPNLTTPTAPTVTPPFTTEDFQANLIMPEPTIFLSRKFPPVSIIRPTETEHAARGAIKSLEDDGLFINQGSDLIELLHDLADAADAAHREG